MWDWERGESCARSTTVAGPAPCSRPDGDLIASTAPDAGVAEVFDAATGETVATLNGHTGGVTDLEFSPDGSVIATERQRRDRAVVG